MHDNLTMLGGQMAQAWKDVFHSWWSSVLSDPNQLSELKSRLGMMGNGGPSVGDVSKLLRALEILDRRMGALESQLEQLATGLTTVVRFLEVGVKAERDKQ